MLHLIQSSPWNNWRFGIKDASGSLQGEIRAPIWAQATNSRLAAVSREDAVAAHMRLPTGEHVIRYEYLRRGWTNDVAWWLESPAGDVLARIERVFPEATKGLPRHLLRLPETGELLVTNARSLQPFSAELHLADGQRALRIRSSSWLTIKLNLAVDGTYGSIPQQAFLAYYALHQR